MTEHADPRAAAREIVAAALQVDAAQVPPDAAVGVTERWDSLAHLRLMLNIEERLGRVLATDELLAIESLADVETLLSRDS